MILMNDFRAEPEELVREQFSAAERALSSGWFILGKELEAFEQQWATYCGTRFAIGVGNGMDALEIGLRSLGIGPGDEVITTPMTAAATLMAILRCGATPVLADIDGETAILDITCAERCITPRTKVVLLVHLYGQLKEMESWAGFCSAHGLFLVEDCAQAHGAVWNGMKAGAFGSCGAYSFYPTKNLGARGDGGALVTGSEEIAGRARVLRNYGQEKRYVHVELGLNSRLDDLQAAILSARLRWLNRWNDRRRNIASTYFSSLSNPGVRLLAQPLQPESHVFHLFVVRCENRQALASHLHSNGIETGYHYPTPVHRQPFARGVSVPFDLNAADQHAATCLSLPCHPQMTDGDVEQVVSAVNRWTG